MMAEFLQNLEQAAGQLSPIKLVLPGMGAVLLGLFTWLSGTTFRKSFAASTGLIAAGAAGYYFSDKNPVATVFSAAIGSLAAVLLERVFIALLSGVLATAVVIGIFVLPGAQEAESLKEILSNVQSHNWAVIAVVPTVAIVAGFLLWRLTAALCYSAIGSALIFAGMIMLLIYKNSMPITAVINRPFFYGAVLIAMVSFGAIVQLLFCGKGGKKSPPAKEDSKEYKK